MQAPLPGSSVVGKSFSGDRSGHRCGVRGTEALVEGNAVETTIPVAGTAVVAFVGEHDLATRDEAAEVLRDLLETNDVIVVDLNRATFIDSAFLQVLLLADAQAKESGKRFHVQVVAESVAGRAMRMAGLWEHFDPATGPDEVIGSPG
jgi:anti-anti-sigma factor